jgi:hypothetical protein
MYSYLEIRHDIEALLQHHSEPGYLESIGESKWKAICSLNLLQSFLSDHHGVSYTELCAMCYLVGTLRNMVEEDENHPEVSQVKLLGPLERQWIGFAMSTPTLSASLFPPDHVFWATLYALSNLEWFGRTRTFQEILLARDARLLTQGICVRWRVVINSMHALLRFLAPSGPGLPSAKCLPNPAKRHDSMLKWVGL